MKNDSDEEEASLNDSIKYQNNFISTIKKILPENIHSLNFNFCNNFDISETDLKDFPGFDKISSKSIKDDNIPIKSIKENEIESLESYSKSFKSIYFLRKDNLNNSMKNEKEEKELLNRKRKREKIFTTKKLPKKIQKHNLGRKKKADKNIRSHNKFSKDNIMNKIRTHFFHFVRDVIKKNSINEKIKILKFQNKFVSDLKKDKNEDVLKMTIKDILSNQPITTKNKKSNEYENRLIIDKILREKKEKNLMKILELTFKELFIIFRKKLDYKADEEEMKIIAEKTKGLDLLVNDDYDDISFLIEDIEKTYKKDENMNEIELIEYIQNVLMSCIYYENWFYDKSGRSDRNRK